jgi:hypothetical protein
MKEADPFVIDNNARMPMKYAWYPTPSYWFRILVQIACTSTGLTRAGC